MIHKVNISECIVNGRQRTYHTVIDKLIRRRKYKWQIEM